MRLHRSARVEALQLVSWQRSGGRGRDCRESCGGHGCLACSDRAIIPGWTTMPSAHGPMAPVSTCLSRSPASGDTIRLANQAMRRNSRYRPGGSHTTASWPAHGSRQRRARGPTMTIAAADAVARSSCFVPSPHTQRVTHGASHTTRHIQRFTPGASHPAHNARRVAHGTSKKTPAHRAMVYFSSNREAAVPRPHLANNATCRWEWTSPPTQAG